MRDFLADLLARLQATNRQQRLYLAVGVLAAIVALRYGSTWLFDYRDGVKADIRLSAQRLASAKKLLERADESQTQLDQLRNRYRQTVSRLVPGDTPTLAAAELQDRVSSIAAKNNVRIQTTQVLKDEAVGPFRQVSLRVTASGEIRNLAGLLTELEFGDLRVTIPFLELSRRGAAIRRRTTTPQARAVSATFQVAGIVASTAALEGEPVPPPAPAGVMKTGASAPAAAAPPPPEVDRPEIDAAKALGAMTTTDAPPPPRNDPRMIRPPARGYQ